MKGITRIGSLLLILKSPFSCYGVLFIFHNFDTSFVLISYPLTPIAPHLDLPATTERN